MSNIAEVIGGAFEGRVEVIDAQTRMPVTGLQSLDIVQSATLLGDPLTFTQLSELGENDWILVRDDQNNCDWRIVIDSNGVTVNSDSIVFNGDLNYRSGWNRSHDYVAGSTARIVLARLEAGEVLAYRLGTFLRAA